MKNPTKEEVEKMSIEEIRKRFPVIGFWGISHDLPTINSDDDTLDSKTQEISSERE